jgi:hypothetical protein
MLFDAFAAASNDDANEQYRQDGAYDTNHCGVQLYSPFQMEYRRPEPKL